MSIEPITGAIIGGITSIASGIFGSSQADKQNREARKAQKKAEKAAEEAADATNEYNKRSFEVDQQNYANTRAFEAGNLNKELAIPN